MGFWAGLLVTGMAVALSGCASKMENSGVTFDRIGQEMTAATAARAKNTDDLLNQAMLPPLQLELPASAQSVEPRFDLAVNNAPASQVFIALVSGTRYSMAVSPEVSGNLTVNLKNVTVREALETIRDMYGYEFKFQGTRIHIQSNAIQTRMFQINYLASTRQGSSEMQVSSNPGAAGSSTPAPTSSAVPAGGAATSGTTGGGTVGGAVGSTAGMSSRVATQTNSDFWGGLQKTLDILVGEGDGRHVVINSQAGVIVVKASPGELRAVESYLKATQVVVERQVMIEAKIIDVQLSEGFQAGVNWGAFKSGANSQFGIGSALPNTTLKTTAYNTPPVNISGTAATPINSYVSGYRAYPTPIYSKDPATPDLIIGYGVPTVLPINTPYSQSAVDAATTAATAASTYMPGQAMTANGVSVTPGQFGSIAATALGKGFLGLALQTTNFAALLNFLETQGTVSVLSSPRIATMNNQKAIIKVGDDSSFVFNLAASQNFGVNGASTVTVTPTFKVFFNGISLDVTPQIDGDDKVVLHVHTLVSTVSNDPKQFAGQSFDMAKTQVKETDSMVRVMDGNIVAIGGLMTQDQMTTREQLPGTGNTPIASLFGQRSNGLNKREMVILLKPTIIRDDQSWVNDMEQTSERLRGLDPRQFSGKAQ